MRLKSSALISALCWSVRLAGAAQIYTYDSDSVPGEQQHSRTLSPVEARLVLAQRTGVEDYHLGGLLSPGGIDAINDFGIRQNVFDGARSKTKKRVLFLMEVGEEQTTIPTSPLLPQTAHFSISPSPSVNSSRTLYIDLAHQSLPSVYAGRIDLDVLMMGTTNAEESWLGRDYYDSFFIPMYPHPQLNLAEFWEGVVARASQIEHYSADGSKISYHLTALVVPHPAAAAGLEQPQSTGREIWGSYAPLAHLTETTFSAPAVALHKRQQESPLEPPSTISPAQESSSPFPGILPACFPSQSSCESLTRNCTGHGSCVLAYTDTSHEEADYKPCYSCQCRPTVRNTTDADGNRRSETTIWAGPACQKRDVSVQFWMLAGVTVGLMFLVSFAVGSLFSVGDATLPSVIGAGVSGIGARGQRQS